MTVIDRADSSVTTDASFQLRDLLIQQVRLEAENVISIQFVAPDGAELPPWTPGAHLDVVLPSGKVRQFSLCGDPADTTSYTVAVLRETAGRGGSVEVHEHAIPGRTLRVRGPKNHFELIPADRYLFIAGGIGITPILPMVREVAGRGADWTLVYTGRSRRTMAFVSALARYSQGQVVLRPTDEEGRIDLADVLGGLRPGAQLYCCGPDALMDEVRRRATGLVPEDAVHVELFTAGEAGTPAVPPADGGTNTFEVVLARSGERATAGPGCTVLEAIRDLAPDVLTDCEEGYCGTCETRVLEGVPEHNDTILTAKDREKNRSMMICVGRAKSERIVLDL